MDNNILKIIGKINPVCANKADASNAGAERKTPAEVVIEAPYTEGLMSLEPGQEVTLLSWLHQAQRDILLVYPRGDRNRPMRGVFNTRSSSRPNPVGLHEVVVQKILRLADGNAAITVLPVEGKTLDVHEDTPLIDIKTNSAQRAAFAAGREREARDLILHCHKAWQRGLLSGFNGNMSVRIADACLITASGAVKGQLGKEDLALVAIADGQLISGQKPSSELAMHLEVYKAQPLAWAIVHTHPPKLLALSELVGVDQFLKLAIYEAAPLRQRLGFAPALPPGTREVALEVAEAARKYEAVLMQKHGLCCWGKNLKEALGLSEELEHLAGMQLMLPRNGR